MVAFISNIIQLREMASPVGRLESMDPDHLSYLIDRHSAALVLFARQWCRAPEDVVQESFIKLVQQTEWPHHPVAWLYRVVRNRAISQSRSERRRQNHEERFASEAREWLDPADNPSRIDAAMASEALSKLPIDQREIIVAHLWGGLTFEHIAEMVDLSAATCWRRYSAGLTALKTVMGETPCPKN
jgi:RNA polymerase sigma factor (sigma-70 family)